MDGTQYAGGKIAEHKARAAAISRRPTKIFFDAMESGHPYVLTLDGMIGADGGLPLIENGKVIGGIGRHRRAGRDRFEGACRYGQVGPDSSGRVGADA
jgi:hypothetical protein